MSNVQPLDTRDKGITIDDSIFGSWYPFIKYPGDGYVPTAYDGQTLANDVRILDLCVVVPFEVKQPLKLTYYMLPGWLWLYDADDEPIIGESYCICTEKQLDNGLYLWTVTSRTDSNICLYLLTRGRGFGFRPTNPEIDSRCVIDRSVNVTGMYTGHIETTATTSGLYGSLKRSKTIYKDIDLGSAVTIKEGYNIELTTAENEVDGAPVTEITIDAGPGLGKGKVDMSCSDTGSAEYATTIETISPDADGNIFLNSDDCIDVQRVTGTIIKIRDDCTECCTCQQFSNAAKVLNELIDQYYYVGAEFEEVNKSLRDINRLLDCNSVTMLHHDIFYPVRCYIDSTHPRKPSITIEIRNVLPAVLYNLTGHVDIYIDEGVGLYDVKAARTMGIEEVAGDYTDSTVQDPDNSARISGINFSDSGRFTGYTSWDVNWSGLTLMPGDTLWCTVTGRSGSELTYDKARTIIAVASADFSYRPYLGANLVAFNKRMADKTIVYSNTKTALIKSGWGIEDISGEGMYDAGNDVSWISGRSQAVKLEEAIRETCKKVNNAY